LSIPKYVKPVVLPSLILTSFVPVVGDAIIAFPLDGFIVNVPLNLPVPVTSKL